MTKTLNKILLKPITTGKELREKMNTYEGLRLLKVLDNDYVYEIKFYEK